MLKSCKYCGRVHDSKFDCGMKPSRQKPLTDINKFRWSRRWGNKREQIKDRDGYLCQVCKHNKKYTYDGLEVHHIVGLAEDFDLRLDDENLITLCVDHHKQADRGEIKKEYLIWLLQL